VDTEFIGRCQAYLLEQLRVVQPRLLLTLGREVPPLLATLAPELQSAWQGARGLEELDRREAGLVFPVQFPDLVLPTAVVALTHPALRHLNIGRRRFRAMTGNDAELALLREAIGKIGAL
jgi:hypothetical protein